MSLVGLIKGIGPSGFGYDSTAAEVTAGMDLSGRHVLVTGCNSGLGLETMRVLALRGARVVACARSLEKARSAAQAVGAEAVPVACDLSEPDSVRAAVDRVASLHDLDAMILNAGVFQQGARELRHGHELHFMTNHLGHFMLATGLLSCLADTGRVVLVTTAPYVAVPSAGVDLEDLSLDRGYSAQRAYGQSKLCNLLFARELAARMPPGQVAIAVHPGVIATGIVRSMPALARPAMRALEPLFVKTVGAGAATQVYAAVHPDAAGLTGQYLIDCNVARSSRFGRDRELARRLWERSETLVALL